MKSLLSSGQEIKPKRATDRIEGNKIILDGWGCFPKRVIIIEPGKNREYELRKTSKGNYQLL